jgi:hypothetical protein
MVRFAYPSDHIRYCIIVNGVIEKYKTRSRMRAATEIIIITTTIIIIIIIIMIIMIAHI